MENENNNKRKFNVLVLDGDPTHDWCRFVSQLNSFIKKNN